MSSHSCYTGTKAWHENPLRQKSWVPPTKCYETMVFFVVIVVLIIVSYSGLVGLANLAPNVECLSAVLGLGVAETVSGSEHP